MPSGPSKGQVLPVDVDTHINAILEFVCGAQVTLTCSFDVWDSELPRMEIYGTEGTVLINEKDPISGPNLFGGDTLMRTPDQYRWADAERCPENVKRAVAGRAEQPSVQFVSATPRTRAVSVWWISSTRSRRAASRVPPARWRCIRLR